MPSSDSSTSPPPVILYVDDEQSNLDTFRFNFSKAFELRFALGTQEGLEVVRGEDIAVVVADFRMPGKTGLQLLEAIHEINPHTVGVILTAYADVDNLVDAINSGFVYRYVQKPWKREELDAILRQSLERHGLLRENQRLMVQLHELNQYLQSELAHELHVGDIVGESKAIHELKATIARVATGNATVLLQGESGTGKELVARAIHDSSPRRDHAFVRVNCAALAPGVLESELFGHERGAFTGAVGRRIGRFELAHRGTIFLDEVGDLPPEVQIRLLRVLQEREFERVGGTETIRIDVRVISATNHDLESLLEMGTFRKDLYYRLNVFPIQLPPIRQRKSDIPLLARHFLTRICRQSGRPTPTLSSAVEERLSAYDWPGNVRELENVIERALILCVDDAIEATHLSFLPRSSSESEDNNDLNLDSMLQAVERKKLEDALDRFGGRVSDVARELGINRTTLYYRLKKYGLT